MLLYNQQNRIDSKPCGFVLQGFFYAQKSEVKRCLTNQSVLVLIPVAVGLLTASNTVPSIKRQWTNITTNMNAILPPIKNTVVHGNASVTATSSRILFVRSARNKAGSLPPKRYTTSSPYPKAEEMRRAISWLFVNPVTQGLLPRAVTGGGGKIFKTI